MRDIDNIISMYTRLNPEDQRVVRRLMSSMIAEKEMEEILEQIRMEEKRGISLVVDNVKRLGD